MRDRVEPAIWGNVQWDQGSRGPRMRDHGRLSELRPPPWFFRFPSCSPWPRPRHIMAGNPHHNAAIFLLISADRFDFHILDMAGFPRAVGFLLLEFSRGQVGQHDFRLAWIVKFLAHS